MLIDYGWLPKIINYTTYTRRRQRKPDSLSSVLNLQTFKLNRGILLPGLLATTYASSTLFMQFSSRHTSQSPFVSHSLTHTHKSNRQQSFITALHSSVFISSTACSSSTVFIQVHKCIQVYKCSNYTTQFISLKTFTSKLSCPTLSLYLYTSGSVHKRNFC